MTWESTSPSENCELSQMLLTRIAQLRDALDEVEKRLQEKHFSCCVVPQLQGVGEIIKAAFQLSTGRTGALVAVERETSLETYVRSGTTINAQLSAPLLLSLFYPGNPLHDGAVIVRRDKILAAGCILPLAVKHATVRAKGLGTRHQAALGISQASDAIVFVVSEETGKISVALDGQLFYQPFVGQLEGTKRLIQLFQKQRIPH